MHFAGGPRRFAFLKKFSKLHFLHPPYHSIPKILTEGAFGPDFLPRGLHAPPAAPPVNACMIMYYVCIGREKIHQHHSRLEMSNTSSICSILRAHVACVCLAKLET